MPVGLANPCLANKKGSGLARVGSQPREELLPGLGRVWLGPLVGLRYLRDQTRRDLTTPCLTKGLGGVRGYLKEGPCLGSPSLGNNPNSHPSLRGAVGT
jgi:hypothetical protein